MGTAPLHPGLDHADLNNAIRDTAYSMEPTIADRVEAIRFMRRRRHHGNSPWTTSGLFQCGRN
jgi:hypothetical protein